MTEDTFLQSNHETVDISGNEIEKLTLKNKIQKEFSELQLKFSNLVNNNVFTRFKENREQNEYTFDSFCEKIANHLQNNLLANHENKNIKEFVKEQIKGNTNRLNRMNKIELATNAKSLLSTPEELEKLAQLYLIFASDNKSAT